MAKTIYRREVLEQQLAESRREFRAADATIHNLELKLTDMAVQLANAESKCRELVAENSAIKVMNDCLSEEMRGYESDGAFEGPKMHLIWWKVKTPATDALLAEVRAQGVEAFVMDFTEPAVMNNGTFYNEDLFEASKEFAAQLRQGAAL